MPPQQLAIDDKQQNWRTLRYINLSRLVVAGLLVVLAFADDIPQLGNDHPLIFTYTAIFYFAGSFISGITLARHIPNFCFYVYIHSLLDIVCLTLLMHASGGIDSGLGMLLLGTIAGTALLSPGQISYFTAAIATLMILAEQLNTHLTGMVAPDYTSAGILGGLLFATALTVSLLIKKLRATEELAKQQEIDLANLSQLNEIVIQKLASGVLVLDEKRGVRLHNRAADQLLSGQPNKQLPEPLHEQLTHWQHHQPVTTIKVASHEIQPHFIQLGSSKFGAVLVLLEDALESERRAHELKLAAMGRLTGSIAHEIRNPLGAISHASQLLAESSELNQADLRLVEIINKQSQRINDIIRNVMDLGQRDRVQPESIDLHSWLESFYQELTDTLQCSTDEIRLELSSTPIKIEFDPSQLRQIIWNLCENGWRHSITNNPPPRLTIRTHHNGQQSPYLEIRDNGEGIPEENREQVFEPFFTTATQGTGLGLYIAKELCAGNLAQLSYIPNHKGACFRILFTAV